MRHFLFTRQSKNYIEIEEGSEDFRNQDLKVPWVADYYDAGKAGLAG